MDDGIVLVETVNGSIDLTLQLQFIYLWSVFTLTYLYVETLIALSKGYFKLCHSFTEHLWNVPGTSYTYNPILTTASPDIYQSHFTDREIKAPRK